MEIKLSAIDLKYVDNIPTYKEDKIRSKAYIAYGSDNKWPDYLYSLYRDVSTLNTLINGSADYTAGNGVQEDYIVNTSGVLLSELIRQIAFDRWLYGGFAIQVIKDQLGRLRELYYIPFNRIRSDENNTEFWYSKDWTTWSPKTIKYPAFDSEKDDPTSIFYFKGNTDQVYPICPFNGSITCCEVEKRINKFHLNEISNNFSGNVVINFNNGVPNEEQQAEIERLVNAKFSGENNAGRVLISYNDSKDQEVTISKIAEDNLDERYKDLAERSRDQIFIAFRATPSLFGLSTSTGFNAEEYQNQFKIYLRTVIKPIQNEIIRAIYKITGKEVIINQFNLF